MSLIILFYGIRNILETVLKEALNSAEDEYQNLGNMAIKECNRITNLIKKLQGFHRPSPSILTSTNINALIDDIKLMYKKELKSRNITLKTHYDNNIPKISVVSDQIKQVILNLIQNANDAIQEKDGKITITTKYVEPNVRIQIEDNGIGIPSKFMSTIFEPFITSKLSIKGTGLGLSISYGIIKKHNGDIKVESQPGKRTTFTIVLPLKEAI